MNISKSLSEFWAAFQDAGQVFCRALGLNMIISGLRSLQYLTVGKGYIEPTKIAIRKSRKTSLLRSFIHLVPLCVALWEITLNWNTYYVGATIWNLAYYQFGAKIHEMTAQASLAAIVFSYVRYEVLLGQGKLPFRSHFTSVCRLLNLSKHVAWASYSKSIAYHRYFILRAPY